MGKREKLLRTAIRLFVNQGFENTPTSKISKEAGVATGTLFHHFKTKEELINAAYLYVKESMGDSVFRGLKKNQKTKQKIKTIWLDLVRWGYEKRIERQFLEKFYGSNYIDVITAEQASEGFELGAQVFMDAKKEKIIKDISIDLFTGVTFSIFYSVSKELEKKKTLDKKLLDQSFDIYWGALRK